MKAINTFVLKSVILLLTCSLQGQSAFHNLDFEKANPGGVDYSSGIAVTSILPGWTVTIGGVQQSDIGYNYPSAGAPAVSVIGNPGYGPTGYTPIDGNFSVLLQGSGLPSAASISQTGLIPSGMQSLLFDAEAGAGTLNLLIGDQSVAFSVVESEGAYNVYGANIAQWSGESEQLTFSALQASQLNSWLIDDISFSTVTVTPEPSIVALTAITGLIFGARKRLSRR